MEEGLVVESVVGAVADEIVESEFTAVNCDGLAADVGVEDTAAVVDDAAVPMGTFCRY